MNNSIQLIVDTVCGMFLPAVLFTCGAILFIFIGRYIFSARFIYQTLKNTRGSLHSLWLALGGTLGVGNICGVASAIYLGGAGCVFWIWICGIFCAVTKYAEILLAVKYREKNGKNFSGGAHYYIKNELGAKNISRLFCILCIATAFTLGNITQVHSAASFAEQTLYIPRPIMGAIFFICVLILTLGKGERIIAFTSKAVPILCAFYTACTVICIVIYREGIPMLTKRILDEAFTPKAGMGGFLGVLCSPAIRLGITRGVTSNEAGCGTAPIGYAADANATPVGSGMLGVCEVIVDTLLLCTLTAYAILLPDITITENSAQTVTSAFTSALGKYITPFLLISIFFFALASVSAWAFYAEKSALFLGSGEKLGYFFTVLYPAASFFGCLINEGIVWILSDTCVSLMAIINVISIILLISRIRAETLAKHQEYKKRQKPL